MAGIKEAMKRVMDEKNKGKVVALGYLKECDCEEDGSEECSDCGQTKYAIIKLQHDNGLITVFDYGGDVRINSDIQLGHFVILWIIDNYCAEWRLLP